MGLSGDAFDLASSAARIGELAGAAKNVALIGFGTVGKSVAKIITERRLKELKLTCVVNRNVERKKVDWVDPDTIWTDKFEDAFNEDVDIVIELIGGLRPAKEIVTRALEAGKSVVTANKQLIAAFGPELEQLARETGAQLLYGASVSGGMPVLPAFESGLGGDDIVEVRGILNGTCNYILSRIEKDGVSFDEALREAQKLGYAEADPTDDVDGYDARAKLAILTRAALRREVAVETIPCRNIRSVKPIDFVYAKKMGCTIRQISRARCEDGTVSAWVQPALIPLSSPGGTAQGSRNVVTTFGRYGGDNVFTGFGAGGNPTAVAVVSDLIAIARGSVISREVVAQRTTVSNDFVAPRYVRFVINDRPGALADLASEFCNHDISIEALLQERGYERSHLPFVITLLPCRETRLREALASIEKLDFLAEKPLALPVLE